MAKWKSGKVEKWKSKQKVQRANSKYAESQHSDAAFAMHHPAHAAARPA